MSPTRSWPLLNVKLTSRVTTAQCTEQIYFGTPEEKASAEEECVQEAKEEIRKNTASAIVGMISGGQL